MPNNFDLSNFALQSICPNNEILYDDKGLPSVMVKIPKMTLSQLGVPLAEGESDRVHPAFIVNGQEIDAIYISKYLNVMYNGRAYSLSNKIPLSTNFSNAFEYCKAKNGTGNKGWHLMTQAEYALIGLWCRINGFVPKGNNNNGKDKLDRIYYAIPSDANNITTTLTGTGPCSWYHDGKLAGISDLNGNLSEWGNGLRTYAGEVQIIENNNAADSTVSHDWKAIDAADGTLTTPSGNGDTTGSVKLDYINNSIIYDTTINGTRQSSRGKPFRTLNKNEETITDNCINVLKSYGLYPIDNLDTYYKSNSFYVSNESSSERVYVHGGRYNSDNDNAGAAGLYYMFASAKNPNNLTNYPVGFRACYCEIPENNEQEVN